MSEGLKSLSAEWTEMSEKRIEDIKTMLSIQFPNEDPDFINFVANLVCYRCNEDFLVILDKILGIMEKAVGLKEE